MALRGVYYLTGSDDDPVDVYLVHPNEMFLSRYYLPDRYGLKAFLFRSTAATCALAWCGGAATAARGTAGAGWWWPR